MERHGHSISLTFSDPLLDPRRISEALQLPVAWCMFGMNEATWYFSMGCPAPLPQQLEWLLDVLEPRAAALRTLGAQGCRGRVSISYPSSEAMRRGESRTFVPRFEALGLPLSGCCVSTCWRAVRAVDLRSYLGILVPWFFWGQPVVPLWVALLCVATLEGLRIWWQLKALTPLDAPHRHRELSEGWTSSDRQR